MKQHNLLDFCYAGLYEIYCQQTQCSYFGHSKNVMYRLGRHFNDLRDNIHDIQELQDDWTKYGRESFCFRVIELGEQWNNKQTRVKREQEIISTCQHRVYNTVSKVYSNFKKQVVIDSVTYSSGAEAARVLGVSPSAMYRFLKKKMIQKLVSGSKPVSIDGQEFLSVTQAMSALGVAKSTLYRRLKSSKYPTWFYIEKTRSNDYPQGE